MLLEKKNRTKPKNDFFLDKIKNFTFKKELFTLLAFALAIVVFLKNAWVSEDAYILFRSIEQLFAGNGPNWNPHERAQVFTSPLWFWLLSLIRPFSADVYLNAIAVSFLLWTLALLVLRRVFMDGKLLLVAVLLFTGSIALYDFTSSGLENPFAFLMIAIYIDLYNRCLSDATMTHEAEKRNNLYWLMVVFGLCLLTRHDLILLLLPSLCCAMYRLKKVITARQFLFLATIPLMPFYLWTMFSLVYYGFAFPNTMYAKINTGIHCSLLISQGITYLWSSVQYDSITMAIIVISMLLSVFKGNKHFRYLSCGILCYMSYVVYVGGDFMQGRFLSYGYFTATIILLFMARKIIQERYLQLLAILCLILVFLPHAPLKTGLEHENRKIKDGIADERGFYFKQMSLHIYLNSCKSGQFIPNHQWALLGLKYKDSSYKNIIAKNIGMLGYYAGVNKIIIDQLALSDPLLARLPVYGKWRIGHFKRILPDGYLDSIENGYNMIKDEKARVFYDKMRLITQGKELFRLGRLKTIVLMNLGVYNKLLEYYSNPKS